MAIRLVRATRQDVGDYVRIGERTRSRFNRVTTDPLDAAKEIEASTTYMIEVDEQRVGFVSYVRLAPDHVYVDEIQVDPDFQGRGIGGFALAAILDELHAVPLVDLHTHPEDPARRLYGRHGFHPVGELIENYQGTGEPRIRMMRER